MSTNGHDLSSLGTLCICPWNLYSTLYISIGRFLTVYMFINLSSSHYSTLALHGQGQCLNYLRAVVMPCMEPELSKYMLTWVLPVTALSGKWAPSPQSGRHLRRCEGILSHDLEDRFSLPVCPRCLLPFLLTRALHTQSLCMPLVPSSLWTAPLFTVTGVLVWMTNCMVPYFSPSSCPPSSSQPRKDKLLQGLDLLYLGSLSKLRKVCTDTVGYCVIPGVKTGETSKTHLQR